jgi:hypothetical protein
MHQAYPEHRQPPLSAEVREEKMLGKEGVMAAAPVPDPRNRTAGQITQKRFQT